MLQYGPGTWKYVINTVLEVETAVLALHAAYILHILAYDMSARGHVRIGPMCQWAPEIEETKGGGGFRTCDLGTYVAFA